MKPFNVLPCILAIAILILLPFSAQGEKREPAGQPAPTAGESGRGAPASHAGGGGGTGPVAATGSATPVPGYGSGAAAWSGAPNLRGTSFATVGTYYNWTNYYSYLSNNYGMDPLYFDRFYRNSEPLITPAILKLTLREPLRMSSEMLDSIDQLEKMIDGSHSGTTLDKEALHQQSERISQLAKKIRNNQTLSYIDLRGKEDLYGQEDERNSLNSQTLSKLREMAVDLNRQLRNTYNQSSTATISVSYYKERSFKSLTKGIEKLCKAIENSSKRM